MNVRLSLFLLCVAVLPAGAAEVAGVRIDDKTRVANGELPLVTVDGPPDEPGCVPRKWKGGGATLQGQCGSLWDALRYEKRIEMAGVDASGQPQLKAFDGERDIAAFTLVDHTGAPADGSTPADQVQVPYPFNSGEELLRHAGDHGMAISSLMLENEKALAPEAEIRQRVLAAVDRKMAEKTANIGAEIMRMAEKSILLQVLDQQWKDHLLQLDHLRQGIHLRGYAQKNPKQEYKREAFELFSMMLEMIKTDVTKFFMLMRLERPEQIAAVDEPEAPVNVQFQHADFSGTAGSGLEPAAEEEGEVAVAEKPQPFVRSGRKVGRNDPCPCGSGKKYKHCHGAFS